MKTSSTLQTAIIAVGGSLAAAHANALELGDVKVHSALGQPLRASIAYVLAPNEAISDTCVSLASGTSASGLPVVRGGSMIVTDGVIAITGSTAINEPLLAMRVNVNCPYTPQLTREYMLFVDPAETAAQPAVASAPVAAAVEPVAVTRASTPRPAAPKPGIRTTRYLVQPGDSLSEIAQRIENRPVGLWPAVNAIFAANPHAFLDNDMNMLKAGTWLDIPDFGAGAPLTVAAQPVADVDSVPAAAAAPVPVTTQGAAASPTVYEPAALAPAASTAVDSGTATEPVAAEPADSFEPIESAGPAGLSAPSEASEASEPSVTDLRPGDVIIDENNPFVGLPDTQLDSPVSTSTSPNVPTAIIRTPAAAETPSPNWIIWLLGGAIALVAGLFAFARLRQRFGSTPIGPESAAPQRRRTDGDTQRLDALGDVDLDFSEDVAAAQGLALDADLEIGSGLSAAGDAEQAPDFAFAATTSLDIELPEEMSSGDSTSNTDIIPPLNIDPESILESEVLPDTEDDDYDMSVIVDVTKMPDPDDITERDLEAIEVPASDDTLITSDYTVSQEVDYSIIEQDYEDELTATQRLNAEIQKAAEDLALRMDEDDSGEISMATVHELDVTAQLQGRNDDHISDDDDTGINPTVNIDADDKTVEMSDDKTVEMRDENTVNMPRKDSKRA